MKAWSYLIALVIGAAVGWVAQQFWLAGNYQLADSKQDAQLSRSELRVRQLQFEVANPVDRLADAQVPGGDDVDEFLFLLQSGRLDEVIALYRDNLSEYAQDIGLSRSLVSALLELGQYQELIALLYEQRLFIDFALEDELLQLIYKTVTLTEQRLDSDQNIDELVALFQYLVTLHPDHIPYSLRLTHWLIEQGSFHAAEQSLLAAANDAEYKTDLAELAARIEKAEAFPEGDLQVISLRKVGKHFVADATMGEGYSVSLMLDTGATMTVVKSAIVEQYGWSLSAATPLQMNTANGEVSGLRLPVSRAAFGDVQIQDVEVAIIPLPNFEFDGLLGMDVLGRYEFFIDQEQSLLLLR